MATTSPPHFSITDSGDVNFVKRAAAPIIQITSVASRLKSLTLSEKGLMGQFIGIWPSEKTMEVWINKN